MEDAKHRQRRLLLERVQIHVFLDTLGLEQQCKKAGIMRMRVIEWAMQQQPPITQALMVHAVAGIDSARRHKRRQS
jgi:hypothetical protein